MSMPKAFVVGWPIAHSRSPLIHRFWLRHHGIEGEYSAEAVPRDSIEAFLSSVASRGYIGGNVTLPHKEAAFRACETLTPMAERLRVVNTLWLEDDRVCGDNTDVHGFAANLDERAPAWRQGSQAVMIGAGGAARAVALAVLDAGFEMVTVLNRTPAHAEALAQHFGSRVRAGGLEALPRALSQADLVVNTTSAEMKGGSDLAIDWRVARRDAIVTDVLYVPLATPFLKGAADRGLKIVDGLGMLLHQAAPGFERWFGVRPRVDAELRDTVVADLAR
jgi:shikimate dehydrogenase